MVRFGGEAEECSGLGGVVGEGGGGECAEAGFALAEYVVHRGMVLLGDDASGGLLYMGSGRGFFFLDLEVFWVGFCFIFFVNID